MSPRGPHLRNNNNNNAWPIYICLAGGGGGRVFPPRLRRPPPKEDDVPQDVALSMGPSNRPLDLGALPLCLLEAMSGPVEGHVSGLAEFRLIVDDDDAPVRTYTYLCACMPACLACPHAHTHARVHVRV